MNAFSQGTTLIYIDLVKKSMKKAITANRTNAKVITPKQKQPQKQTLADNTTSIQTVERPLEEMSVHQVKESYLTQNGYVHPIYPISAMRRNISGTVTVEVDVDKGKLLSQKVIKSSGSIALDFSAQNAIRQWHFKPTASLRQRLSIEFAIQ